MKNHAMKILRLVAVFLSSLLVLSAVLWSARQMSGSVLAATAQPAPIPPPDGFPKLSLSSKTVSPTLVTTAGEVLEYTIEILNTGAYTATDVSLVDAIPSNTTYNNDAWASAPPEPVFTGTELRWEHGVVGFDESVLITFSVTIQPGYSGVITNAAVITDPLISEPVVVQADAMASDDPALVVAKTATPEQPGPGHPMTYELVVTNQGQPAVNMPITLTDYVPADTTFRDVDPWGMVSPAGDIVTWTRSITLDFGASTVFTFSVDVADVPSGTVIQNDQYQVASPYGISAGEPHTVTVVSPVFLLGKSFWPDPPGSNHEMTYTITVLNIGSLATDLVITDVVPAEVEYVRGGSYSGGVVTWQLAELDTGMTAEFTYTVSIGDEAGFTILNEFYAVCSAAGACASGLPVATYVSGPIFEAWGALDPIAKKPGGGTGPVTPTLVITNTGPGNALDATAMLYFDRISVSLGDLQVIPDIGTVESGPPCGDNCVSYRWIGDVAVGDVITFTTYEGQSTIGGEEGTHYTATVVITDSLGAYVTDPVTGTADGIVTHYANLNLTKSAPPYIGAGQEMTYTISVWNSGLSTDVPPMPWLTETVPASVTLISIGQGGVSTTIGAETVISWTLPEMSPGDLLQRTFAVRVDEGLVSGTEIINADYMVTWYEEQISGTLSGVGAPVVTVVRDIGLIDSFKTVTPTFASPGPGNVLTYVVNVVNTSPMDLHGVQVHDTLPWADSTYQRDAIASSGSVISDIVSIDWSGDVMAYSAEQITFTVLVDSSFEGAITNTAVITHPSLAEEVVVSAVAYITDDPVLEIHKVDSPDPVNFGADLLYTIYVTNLAQQATALVVTDTIPQQTEYLVGSASAGGQLVGDTLFWNLPVLRSNETAALTFRVTVLGGSQIINAAYGVTCAEGVSARGAPVVTAVRYPNSRAYLPLLAK
jgi:uncharacterized repeat protein (TIGR01451 family)